MHSAILLITQVRSCRTIDNGMPMHMVTVLWITFIPVHGYHAITLYQCAGLPYY
jgi:hypothetical protein